MSEEIEVVYEEDPDYSTVYADNVILQIGETCRLIFYQDVVKVTDDHKIDKNTRRKRLKFEVRLPLTTVQRLTNNGSNLVNLHYHTLNLVQGKKDPKVIEAWWKMHGRMRKSLYDTENFVVDAKTNQQLNDDLEELSGRISHSEKDNSK